MNKFFVIVATLIMTFSVGCSNNNTEISEPKDVKEKQTTQKAVDYDMITHDSEQNSIHESEKIETPKQEDIIRERDQAIQSGDYKVGEDIPAGEFIVIASGLTYIEARKDKSEEVESIIFNDNLFNKANTYVTLEDGEYFKLQSGEMYLVADAPSLKPDDGVYQDGMYKVGSDIQPGEYQVSLAKDSILDIGYIEISEDSRHNLRNIISNEIVETEVTITLIEGQYIKLQGVCIEVDE